MTLTIIYGQPPSSAYYLDVKRDFGAAFDGVTDDTTAWQNCLNAVPATGATIVVPPGISLVPNGGLTYGGTGLKILALAGADADAPASAGSILKMTASTGTLLTISGPGVHIDGLTFTHTGTRTTCIGLSMTDSHYMRLRDLTFDGFATNLKIDTSGYWSLQTSTFRNALITNLDIANTTSADFLVATVSGCIFLRDDAVTGGACVTYRTGGGLRFIDNGIEGSGANPYDYGLRVQVPDGKIMSVLQITGNTIEQFQVAGISIEPLNTTGRISNSITIVGNEINSLSLGGKGINFGLMGTAAVTISANSIYLCTEGMFVDNVNYVAISGNAMSTCSVSGIHLGSNMRNCIVDESNAIDCVLGAKDYINDGPKLATWSKFTQRIYFPNITDTADHELFEIGIIGDSLTFDLELGAHQSGASAILRRLSREVVWNSSADSTINTIGTDYAGAGACTLTVTGTGLGGPVRVKIARTVGSAIDGQCIVKVQGEGFTYFKSLLRNS